jgi:hypothetical protein
MMEEGTMKALATALVMAGLLVIGAPAPASAQSEVGADGWWSWAAPAIAGGEVIRTRRGDVRIPDRVEDVLRGRDARRGDARRGDARGRGQARQGQGPPFCRNGQGHPVHGREWCRAKGWSATWGRLGDVGIPLPRDRRPGGILDQGRIGGVLDRVVFGRLDERRRQLGVDAPMEGRWLTTTEGARVLQVRAGGVPIAEFTDLNGDGHADLVLLNEG